jgi:hypothetical protein
MKSEGYTFFVSNASAIATIAGKNAQKVPDISLSLKYISKDKKSHE